MIRITSGFYKGQNIKSPNSEKTHPMGSREKLALFNMLSEYLKEAVVLDAYAGSGALGIEAVSRGAKEATFVEKDPRVCQVIRENLKNLNLQANVICDSVVNFTTPEQFDIIIADPPYNKYSQNEIEHLLEFLKPDGVLVLSHPDNAKTPTKAKLLKTRKYANANISIYTK